MSATRSRAWSQNVPEEVRPNICISREYSFNLDFAPQLDFPPGLTYFYYAIFIPFGGGYASPFRFPTSVLFEAGAAPLVEALVRFGAEVAAALSQPGVKLVEHLGGTRCAVVGRESKVLPRDPEHLRGADGRAGAAVHLGTALNMARGRHAQQGAVCGVVQRRGGGRCRLRRAHACMSVSKASRVPPSESRKWHAP